MVKQIDVTVPSLFLLVLPEWSFMSDEGIQQKHMFNLSATKSYCYKVIQKPFMHNAGNGDPLEIQKQDIPFQHTLSTYAKHWGIRHQEENQNLEDVCLRSIQILILIALQVID